jgi:RNA polymerase sigma-32 factor
MSYASEEGLTAYRAKVASFDPLDTREEGALAAAWRGGDARAGARLIASNLRYVIGIAREYRRWGVPLEDLVQQGNIGLLKAAERFDPSEQSSLRAYASYWIRAEIRDYVVRGYRIVRLGTTRTERRALRAYRTSSVADADELAQRSGMPEDRCRMLWPLLVQGDRSLDAVLPGGSPARDFLRDPGPDPESAALGREAREHDQEQVERALAVLSDRERRIVWARMASDEPETLEQIGRRIGVSRERVRQLEERAKQKMQKALSA